MLTPRTRRCRRTSRATESTTTVSYHVARAAGRELTRRGLPRPLRHLVHRLQLHADPIRSRKGGQEGVGGVLVMDIACTSWWLRGAGSRVPSRNRGRVTCGRHGSRERNARRVFRRQSGRALRVTRAPLGMRRDEGGCTWERSGGRGETSFALGERAFLPLGSIPPWPGSVLSLSPFALSLSVLLQGHGEREQAGRGVHHRSIGARVHPTLLELLLSPPYPVLMPSPLQRVHAGSYLQLWIPTPYNALSRSRPLGPILPPHMAFAFCASSSLSSLGLGLPVQCAYSIHPYANASQSDCNAATGRDVVCRRALPRPLRRKANFRLPAIPPPALYRHDRSALSLRRHIGLSTCPFLIGAQSTSHNDPTKTCASESTTKNLESLVIVPSSVTFPARYQITQPSRVLIVGRSDPLRSA